MSSYWLVEKSHKSSRTKFKWPKAINLCWLNSKAFCLKRVDFRVYCLFSPSPKLCWRDKFQSDMTNTLALWNGLHQFGFSRNSGVCLGLAGSPHWKGVRNDRNGRNANFVYAEQSPLIFVWHAVERRLNLTAKFWWLVAAITGGL